jgi:hypothetical protein
MAHKYRLNQMVRLVKAPRWDFISNGGDLYEVIRLLPADASGEVSYRVRVGNTERAVRDSEIKNPGADR